MPMKPLRSFLDRFRRTAGVPASVSGDAVALAELGSLLAALDEIDGEAGRRREGAMRAAQSRLREIESEIEQILVGARQQAEAERAEVMEASRRAAEAEARAAVEAAAAEAERIRERGRARIPALVDEVLRCLDEGSA